MATPLYTFDFVKYEYERNMLETALIAITQLEMTISCSLHHKK
jgi:hypothetical protein